MFGSKFAPYIGVLGVSAGSGYLLQNAVVLAGTSGGDDNPILAPVPSRAQLLSRLRGSTRDKPFDLLIIGGGATGAGCAVDAVTRGLRTALVEREDFGSGTSSKSTKLVHGGVRYLEKAVFNLDYGQLKLVYEALHERSALLANAAHLTGALPILLPCYRWWEVPFYWGGLKAYDVIAGGGLAWSRYLSPAESGRRLPTLAVERPDGSSLKGSILYYDGQFDDARLNVALAATAAAVGGAVANYVEVVSLLKNPDGQVIGARCRDAQSGEALEVYAKVVINATGPFVDNVRHLSDTSASNAITASSGTHVTLPEWYGAKGAGLIVPKTKDGRVVFMLPWQGHIIAGTTDAPCDVTARPLPTEEEVAFILGAIGDFLRVKVRREDVLSAWTGIRPLAADPTAHTRPGDTASLLRDHVIFSDAGGVITVTGGKWTTYRRMAQDAVDAALDTGRLPPARPCVTAELRLVGAQRYHPLMHAELAQSSGSISAASSPAPPPLPPPVARHLAAAYGDRAFDVMRLAYSANLAAPLAAGHPIIEAEVVYACSREMCATVEDFLARRCRLAFVDVRAAAAAAPRVAELMAGELGWGGSKRKQELERALAYLRTFQPH